MNVLLLGPPGSGKGTIAQVLVETGNYGLLSTGHMLRQAIADKTELGLKAQAIMDSGKLVSDEIMLGLVAQFLADNAAAKGIVFDGFPRTLVQAKAMQERLIKVDKVIFLRVADEVIVARMAGRRVHPDSGRVYHLVNNPPVTPNTDDITGEPLITRADDKEEVVRERLRVYREQTEPLVEFYRTLAMHGDMVFQEVDAALAVDKVIAAITSN